MNIDPSKLSDQMAEMLLEMMLKDSAYEFESGVRNYIESNKAVKKYRRQLEHSIRMEHGPDKIMKALKNYDIALRNKQTAIRNIKNEYMFLNSERKIKPVIDGKYVMNRIVKQVCSEMSEAELEELVEEAKQARMKCEKFDRI